MSLYHHCRSLDSIVYGSVEASPIHADKFFKDAYSWLETEVGFYPIFLSVGTTHDDIRMTGYQNQWKKENKSNDVLFSFSDIVGVFMDYIHWHLVLNAGYKNYQMTDYEKRLIFKPSWKKSRWLRKAKENPHSVQLVTSELNLPSANSIWVRNVQAKKELTKMGFDNIKVKRIPLEEPE